ncbi:polysaccharide biosynthesis C-terminal domain-containing protein [Nocardioides panacisoli]|uniref:lipopolysaccharide biosynthesis protein n=1 Tax=Nocardioides panacisoli TaxID=627624 RepID=UPI001C637AAA|nr:polysaccharide biosynthesis C-terminal domain-containing protein [Nocardioides panacisoli]QYJ04210.1 polysaccharide biosynthesis C-terminal domain-containing protein [Nocardioides panacisoli]
MTTLGRAAPARTHLDRVARGGFLGLLGAVAAALSGFALVAVITRGVSADVAGTFFAVTSMFLIVEGVAALGTGAGLGRFLLRHEAAGRPEAVAATLRTAAVPVLLTATVAGAALFVLAGPIAAWAGLGEAGVAPLRVVAPVLPCAAAAELALAAARAFGEIRSTVLVDRVVRSGLQLLLACLVLALGGGLAWLAAAWAAAYLVAAALALAALRRTLRRRREVAPPASVTDADTSGVAREFWSFTWLPGISRVAQLGMQKLDIILVAALISPATAAVYTAATRFVPLGQLAVQAIQQVLQPQFTAILISEDTTTLRQVHRVASAWSIVLAWPLHVSVAALAGTYLAIFGDDIAGVDGALATVLIMAAAMMVAVATGPVDTLLLMSGRSRASATNAVAALVTDITLCVLLIPRWGLVGAAVAWAAAVLLRCGLAYHQVNRGLGVRSVGRQLLLAGTLPILCLGAPLVVISQLSSGSLLGVVVAVVVAGAAYLAALRRFRAELELDHLWAALARRRGGRR